MRWNSAAMSGPRNVAALRPSMNTGAVGISLPGTGETPVAPVYVDGQKTVTLKGERIAEEFEQIVVDYVRATYGGEQRSPSLVPQPKTVSFKPPASERVAVPGDR